jgi:hypothetical protein
MKTIYLLFTVATLTLTSGCMTERARAEAEARRYHTLSVTPEIKKAFQGGDAIKIGSVTAPRRSFRPAVLIAS